MTNSSFVRTDCRDAAMTSLVGYVDTDYDTLVKVFGVPEGGDGYKVNAEWVLKFEDGCVVTIYDWKESVKPEDVRCWHIGGKSPDAVAHLREALTANRVFAGVREWR